jgi:hypothetical protein
LAVYEIWNPWNTQTKEKEPSSTALPLLVSLQVYRLSMASKHGIVGLKTTALECATRESE